MMKAAMGVMLALVLVPIIASFLSGNNPSVTTLSWGAKTVADDGYVVAAGDSVTTWTTAAKTVYCQEGESGFTTYTVTEEPGALNCSTDENWFPLIGVVLIGLVGGLVYYVWKNGMTGMRM